MIQNRLKERETIAYLSLKNDLEKGRVAHSYLFYGEVNPLKKEVAFLLAQSIIEGKNGFACEECATCKRIREGHYYDVIYIDGYRDSIKTEQMDSILEEFSKTSLEEAGKKVYIVDNINHASAKALNMILKFMEEPGNGNTFGIFISDDIDTLLPTIVSRCQKVPFMTRDFSYRIEEFVKRGHSKTDAYLLSRLHIREEDDECYAIAREFVNKSIEDLSAPAGLPFLFFHEFYPSMNKEQLKPCTDLFLDLFLIMIDDAMSGSNVFEEDYLFYLSLLRKQDLSKILKIILEAKDKTALPISRTLLFDQIAFKILS